MRNTWPLPGVQKLGTREAEEKRRPEKCENCKAAGAGPGVFYVFRPSHLERIVNETMAKDEEEMEKLRKRGIVPDDDEDHAALKRNGHEEEEETG